MADSQANVYLAASDAHISYDAAVIDSEIDSSAQIFRMAYVKHSKIAPGVIIGDLSRIDESVINERSRIDRFNHLYGVSFGSCSYTGPSTVIMKSAIGRFCSISWGVTIGPANHDYTRLTSHSMLYNPHFNLVDDVNQAYYDRFSDECTIGNDVWIGANSTVLRGVSVGNGVVIGANSLVNKSVPPYAIVVGNPARIIKFRFEQDIIAALEDLEWWDLPIEMIKKHLDIMAAAPTLEMISRLKSVQEECC